MASTARSFMSQKNLKLGDIASKRIGVIQFGVDVTTRKWVATVVR